MGKPLITSASSATELSNATVPASYNSFVFAKRPQVLDAEVEGEESPIENEAARIEAEASRVSEMDRKLAVNGNVVSFESVSGLGMVQATTDLGETKLIPRNTLLHRCLATLEMLEKEFNQAGAPAMDKGLWVVHRGFHAALKNGRQQGAPNDPSDPYRYCYDRDFVRMFDSRVKHVDHTWKRIDMGDTLRA